MMPEKPEFHRAIDAVYAAISLCKVHPNADLNKGNASKTSIASLELDSLDLLQMAMDVEEALEIEVDIVEFPGDATLLEVAEHFHKIMLSQHAEAQ